MYVKRLELSNWLRYRGKHRLDLGPSIFGIVGEREGNPDSSNWSGKSSLLEAIVFALYGFHRFRTDDEWITRGEQSGGVGIVCDGLSALRTRKRGKATQLWCKVGEREAHQEDAQRLIEETIGLSQNDFFNTCYFEQKQMSRFVTAKPAERMEIVTEWLELEPLQLAENSVRKKLGELSSRAGVVGTTLMAHETRLAQSKTRVEIESDVRMLAEDLEKKRAHVKALEADQARLKAETKDAGLLAEFDALCASMAASESKLAGLHCPSKAEVVEAGQLAGRLEGEIVRAEDELSAKRQLVRGGFDGVCPVAGDSCPISKEINENGQRNEKLYQIAQKKFARAKEDAAPEVQRHADMLAKTRAYAIEEQRLAVMREQAERLRPQAEKARGKAVDPAILAKAAEAAKEAWQAAQAAERALANAERDLAERERLEAELARLAVERDDLLAEVTVHREALAILGRNGAQRRVAEGALAEIERGANALLSESGIDLSVKVLWARENSKVLATACDQCGAAYGASQRIKECPQCGAARGAKLDERLDIVLSDVSGAAEDLAGCAFQLSAGAWLRRKRDSVWECVLIDEPFVSLDAHLRKALSVHLAKMLRSAYAYAQCFVIAHQRDSLDALPGRIVVTGYEDHSEARVM